ncbi:unnamed protein product [Rodentolepis nana]|uniref:Shikimate kinase n=1 Tax=Rodentolepis nana TaxID=102285 RepID=A0A0R3TMJ3_RODNA|nr:unnamed protein product [Rodentolepis nana]
MYTFPITTRLLRISATTGAAGAAAGCDVHRCVALIGGGGSVWREGIIWRG